jgi:hypothetical protein
MVSAKRGTRLGWPSGRRARDVVRFGSGRRPWASEQRSVSCPPAFLTARTVRGGLFGCSSCRRALPMDHPVCGLGSKSARIAPDRAAACRPRRAGRSCRKEQLAPHDGCHHRQRNRPTEHGPSVRVRKLVRAHGSRPRRKRDHAHVEAREWLEVRQVGRSLPRFCSDVHFTMGRHGDMYSLASASCTAPSPHFVEQGSYDPLLHGRAVHEGRQSPATSASRSGRPRRACCLRSRH